MLRKKILFTILLIFILILLIVLCTTPKKEITEVCFKNSCYEVEIAETKQERATGLMFRETLEASQGMLFIFPKEDIYPFWMKNTLITLDIIWLNEEKRVVFIHKEAEPCQEDKCPSITPNKEAFYVVELKAGEVRRIGLKEGEKIDFK